MCVAESRSEQTELYETEDDVQGLGNEVHVARDAGCRNALMLLKYLGLECRSARSRCGGLGTSLLM